MYNQCPNRDFLMVLFQYTWYKNLGINKKEKKNVEHQKNCYFPTIWKHLRMHSSHGGWRSRFHCYSQLAPQDGLNGRLSSSFSFFSFWLIKTWCTSKQISDHASRINELHKVSTRSQTSASQGHTVVLYCKWFFWHIQLIGWVST